MAKIPTSPEDYPPHLIRSVDLEAAGLQPALHQKPIALLRYKGGNGLCGLYEREQLMPRKAAS